MNDKIYRSYITIFGGMAAQGVFFIIVEWILLNRAGWTSPHTGLPEMAGWVFTVIALLSPVIILLWKNKEVASWQATGTTPRTLLTRSILWGAISELPAVMGLMQFLLGLVDFRESLYFILGSGIPFFLAYISPDQWKDLTRAHYQGEK